jgi:NTE family protein
MSTALVLAGGGVTGIAWETGVLHGLAQAGTPIAPDLVVGTSAGSVVGAQLLSGTPLEDLYARQLSGGPQELAPTLDFDRLIAFYVELGADLDAPSQETLRRVGVFARETATVPVAVRQEVIANRLPSHDWPAVPFLVPTVDAETGELVVLSSSSGVTLVDAVTASCAVPGVWPVVPLLDRLLMDGGVRSLSNLDLAAGHDDVLVLLPMSGRRPQLELEVEQLRSTGAAVRVIVADDEATAAMGPNPLDPSYSRAAAEAGLRQGMA